MQLVDRPLHFVKVFWIYALVVVGLHTGSGASAEDVARHPSPPTRPLMLSEKILPAAAKVLEPVPAEMSPRAFQDYGELYYWQHNRKPEDCEAARRELYITLESFFGEQLKPEEISALDSFFLMLRGDTDYFIQKLKLEYPRPRPYLYLKGLEPCLPREASQAYPSGHATLAQVFALVLSDFFPERRTALTQRAQTIGTHRTLVGVHHRSDIEAGYALGNFLYKKFNESGAYRKQKLIAESKLRRR